LTSGIPLPAAAYKTLAGLPFPLAFGGVGCTDLVRRVRQADSMLYAVAKAM